MKPLMPAVGKPEEIAAMRREVLAKWRAGDAVIRQSIPTCKESEAIRMIDKIFDEEINGCALYKNDMYQVAVRDLGENLGVHLSIKRIDRAPIHDWRDLQEIKNQLVGPECEGVELYPAESRRVDTANQYHLFVVKDTKYRFPFGFTTRVVTEDSLGNSVNRPFA